MNIDLSHGSGGKQTSNLIHDIFLKNFDNEILNKLEDAAVLDISGRIAYTTDSFVQSPNILLLGLLLKRVRIWSSWIKLHKP